MSFRGPPPTKRPTEIGIQKISGCVTGSIGKVGMVKKVKTVKGSKLSEKRYEKCYEVQENTQKYHHELQKDIDCQKMLNTISHTKKKLLDKWVTKLQCQMLSYHPRRGLGVLM